MEVKLMAVIMSLIIYIYRILIRRGGCHVPVACTAVRLHIACRQKSECPIQTLVAGVDTCSSCTSALCVKPQQDCRPLRSTFKFESRLGKDSRTLHTNPWPTVQFREVHVILLSAFNLSPPNVVKRRTHGFRPTVGCVTTIPTPLCWTILECYQHFHRITPCSVRAVFPNKRIIVFSVLRIKQGIIS